jgi:hypothetical protein
MLCDEALLTCLCFIQRGYYFFFCTILPDAMKHNSWRLILVQLIKKFLRCIKPEVTTPHPQKLATGSCLKPERAFSRPLFCIFTIFFFAIWKARGIQSKRSQLMSLKSVPFRATCSFPFLNYHLKKKAVEWHQLIDRIITNSEGSGPLLFSFSSLLSTYLCRRSKRNLR